MSLSKQTYSKHTSKYLPSSSNNNNYSIIMSMTYDLSACSLQVSEGAKITNRYNQVPHLTQDTNGKLTNSQLYNTNERQEVSPFPAGDHKVQINRRAQRHNKRKRENT